MILPAPHRIFWSGGGGGSFARFLWRTVVQRTNLVHRLFIGSRRSPIPTRLHPHARSRLAERGADEAEVVLAVEGGEQFPAKFGRTGFRRNFPFDGIWRGKRYLTKQIEAYAVWEDDGWLVITVLVKYF
jgi:hypothetical protein